MMRSTGLRVALVSPYSLAVPGGVQGQVLGLARALRAHGVSAQVLGPCDGPPPRADVRSVGSTISYPVNGSVAPIALAPAALRRTLEILADERPDVVHLHEPLVPGPNLAALLGSRIPAVGTFHASGRIPAYQWLRPALRAFANRLQARTAVSREATALAERWLGGTYQVLPNGVDVERFAKADRWPTDDRAILFVGRHEPRKGLEVLLEAFAGLPADDTVLWVAGEGPATAHLKATVGRRPEADRVRWLGRISDDELARRLRAATVFCAPSLHGESFGIVLLEAMAAGTPIVASDISGYRDVARAGHEAVLVDPGDPAKLRDGLLDVLTDDRLADGLVEAGTARATHFSLDRLAERFTAIYESIAP